MVSIIRTLAALTALALGVTAQDVPPDAPLEEAAGGLLLPPIPGPSIVLPELPTTLLTVVPGPSGLLTCATVLCIPGYVCRETEGRPECVPPVPRRCGNVICPVGTRCCNASCNLCTAPDVMCTQQICESPLELPPAE
ncbi:hypothetical protein CTA2_12342 [Colletotrichum tanaceti]|uniref:WAP domain-containing protein n=1 Tax=Colletotrichum tanaceti TaxID=1306861 RepID=A0A4U6XTE0_9PEZI|nr:hypothetical protein CTA2_12342 [Colletotrichum tanaceti]TKW59059.1 hypothetical protein CTA1_13352 [Colletotrichum tanaceti]